MKRSSHIFFLFQIAAFIALCGSLLTNNVYGITKGDAHESSIAIEIANAAALQTYETSYFKPAFSSTGNNGTKAIPSIISEIETEDEFHTSHKNYSEVSRYFVSAFHFEPANAPNSLTALELPFHKHLAYSLSIRWHSMFQIFRL